MNEKILEFKNDIIRIAIAAILVIISHLGITIPLDFIGINYTFDLAWIALILCGIPIIYGSIIGLVYEHDIKADILVSIAIIASVFIGEVFAAAEIAVIMEIGGLLEEITVSTTQLRIEKLVELQPSQARLVKDKTETMVDSLNLVIGDIVKILPGETIPADGKVIEGNTAVNQAILTGESVPVDKTVGDEVFAGTINSNGLIVIEVTENGKDNSLQKLINLIESVNAEDTPIIRQADKWANWVVIISFTTAILTLIFTQDIYRAVTVLVVFCPCALILATPTAIIAAIGNLSKYGILVKNAETLESMFKSDKILFDKTGTITTGVPKVVDVETFDNVSEDELMQITASAESNSEHPIAKAIVTYYKEDNKMEDLYSVTDFEMELGMGIKGKINGKEYLIGNQQLFEKHNIELPDTSKLQDIISTSTAIYTWYDNKFLGLICIKDTPREGMENTIQELVNENYEPVLLTGDNELVANDIAGQIGISEVHADCLPETKLEYVEDSQRHLKEVVMIGDGINDASAMKKANVGVAMGDVGSDITIDSADMVFINDDIRYLPYLLKMSKRTYQTINIGIAFSLTLNTIAMILGIIGVLTPITGALVHNVGSVLVIIFAAMLFRRKPDYLNL